jgi:hypothetical protein
MIYQYPKEFTIPVIYVDDLKVETSYRNEDFESSLNLKSLMVDEDLQGYEIFKGETYMGSNKDINFSNMDENSVLELYKETMIKDNSFEESVEYKNENVDGILSDIDNEYADGETLRI